MSQPPKRHLQWFTAVPQISHVSKSPTCYPSWWHTCPALTPVIYNTWFLGPTRVSQPSKRHLDKLSCTAQERDQQTHRQTHRLTTLLLVQIMLWCDIKLFVTFACVCVYVTNNTASFPVDLVCTYFSSTCSFTLSTACSITPGLRHICPRCGTFMWNSEITLEISSHVYI